METPPFSSRYHPPAFPNNNSRVEHNPDTKSHVVPMAISPYGLVRGSQRIVIPTAISGCPCSILFWYMRQDSVFYQPVKDVDAIEYIASGLSSTKSNPDGCYGMWPYFTGTRRCLIHPKHFLLAWNRRCSQKCLQFWVRFYHSVQTGLDITDSRQKLHEALLRLPSLVFLTWI